MSRIAGCPFPDADCTCGTKRPVASSPLNPEEWDETIARQLNSGGSASWSAQVLAIWTLCNLAAEGRLILAPSKPRRSEAPVSVELPHWFVQSWADKEFVNPDNLWLYWACRDALGLER